MSKNLPLLFHMQNYHIHVFVNMLTSKYSNQLTNFSTKFYELYSLKVHMYILKMKRKFKIDYQRLNFYLMQLFHRLAHNFLIVRVMLDEIEIDSDDN